MTTQRQPLGYASTPPPEEEIKAMSLIEHLVELRGRLVKASIGIVIGIAIGLFLVLGPPQIVNVIIEQFTPPAVDGRPPLQSVGTAEEFTSFMTVALGVGFIVGMPAIVYQLLAFIVPGLTDRERRILYLSLPFVMLFFLGGLAFGWFITVPVAVQFLIGFSNSELIESQPSLANFLRTVTTLLLINGVVFELPVIIYVLAFLGVTNAKQLGQYRRFAALGVTIIAAFITPTGDPINLALLAIPMYLLYEVGIIVARFVPKRE